MYKMKTVELVTRNLQTFAPLIAFLLCNLVISNSEKLQDEVIHWSVVEESKAGVVIGDLRRDIASLPFFSSSPIHADDVRFRLLPKPNQNLSIISFDEQSGVMKTSLTPIDRERQCQNGRTTTCAVEMSVALIHSVQLIQVVNIQLDILDINDHSPVFDQPQYRLSVLESSVVGSSIALPLASDSDAAQFGVSSYHMDPTFPELTLSLVNSSSGAVLPFLVVNSTIDRERAASYTFRVTAVDGGGSSGTTEVLVTIEDVNDNSPVFSQPRYHIKVREDRPVDNEALFVAMATDADSGNNGVVDYSFDAETMAVNGRRFAIDRTTGHVTLTDGLDYERDASFRLGIVAVDRGLMPLTGQTALVVQVEDVNDNYPQVTVNTLSESKVRSEVAEHQAPGMFIAHVSVYDPDSGENGRVTCQLVNGASQFVLDRIIDGQYKLTTGVELNYSEHPSHVVTILCSDSAVPPLSTAVSLTVDVIDLNDRDPVFDRSLYEVTVAENNPPGQILLRCNASDADSGLNGQLVYSLAADSSLPQTDASSLVSIDPDECFIRASQSFDYELTQQLEFLIKVQDKGLPSRSSLSHVLLRITDINDLPPIFTQPTYLFQLSENRQPGSVVGHVTAVDHDSYPFNQFYFKMSDENPPQVSDRFSVGSATGVITARVILDREDTANYTLKLTVYDALANLSASPEMSSDATVEILVTDENDNFPQILFPDSYNGTVFNVSSELSSDHVIFRVEAFDPDAGENSSLVFGLTGPNRKYFVVDEISGDVRINSNTTLVAGGASLLPVTVTVSDKGAPPKMSTVEVLIELPYQVVEQVPAAAEEAEASMTATVAILVCVSAVIVLLLLLSIVLLKMKEQRRRKTTSAKHITLRNGSIYRNQMQQQQTMLSNGNSCKRNNADNSSYLDIIRTPDNEVGDESRRLMMMTTTISDCNDAISRSRNGSIGQRHQQTTVRVNNHNSSGQHEYSSRHWTNPRLPSQSALHELQPGAIEEVDGVSLGSSLNLSNADSGRGASDDRPATFYPSSKRGGVAVSSFKPSMQFRPDQNSNSSLRYQLCSNAPRGMSSSTAAAAAAYQGSCIEPTSRPLSRDPHRSSQRTPHIEVSLSNLLEGLSDSENRNCVDNYYNDTYGLFTAQCPQQTRR